ncbi:MAG: ATP-dependent sacrificial sulfur transferase LarE [Bacteroidales bacterium]|nr:ATP-dependent sacrificial sulfur transferase LarE [Bacteroidales bacterium]
MKKELEEKYRALSNILLSKGSVLVAYSGGVDSAFLAYAARKELGKNMKAIMFTTQVHTGEEIKEAYNFAYKYEIPMETISINVIKSEAFTSNPRDRCYHCKLLLFKNAVDYAEENGFCCVADGSNLDDLGDYRPGMKALKELNIISPLQDASLTKEDIRELSRFYGLPTSDKEAMACLATRIPYGDEITCNKLDKVAAAEMYLRKMGYRRVRARHFEDTVKIEVESSQVQKLKEDQEAIAKKMQEIGYEKVAIDPKGYRTGSMNEE